MKRVEGVELSDKERSYLLPHFLMLLVGKPGSGKTTMIKHLVMDKEFFRGKFDSLMIVSPSHSKIGLPLNAQDSTSEFSLKWIYENLDRINKRQQSKLERVVAESMKVSSETYETQDHSALLKAVTMDTAAASSLSHTSSILATKSRDVAMYAGLTSRGNNDYTINGMQQGGFSNPFSSKKTRFGKSLRGETQMVAQMTRVQNNMGNNVNEARRRTTKAITKNNGLNKFPKGGYQGTESSNDFYADFISRVSNLDKKILTLLSPEQIATHRTNVLIILDDVVGPIKALQNDPYLAQLFFNRRHLIANGTVSIILVTQKYTMIPARIRSNASWLILFRLNPIDFDNVYQDAFTGSLKRFKELLVFVFGNEDENMEDIATQRKNKNFDNLGIWVETDTYFSNFQQITFGKSEDSQLIEESKS